MRWDRERTNAWKKRYGNVQGCNYLPRTAVNATEMWQKETFDPAAIKEELGWASKAGFNALRVFFPYVVWEHDRDGLIDRVRTFLALADDHGMHVMGILFDDCAFSGKQPYPGKQSDPVPGVHNSGWTPSPGFELALSPDRWAPLERYVKDMTATFATDERLAVWDLYNEPGNSDLDERTMPLVEAAFSWAREMNPAQPLTVGAWQFLADGWSTPVNERLWALSDMISFHYYGQPDDSGFKAFLELNRGKLLLCTEWLHRQSGNTFETLLPIWREFEVGWYIWGLVAGRTQTYCHWGSEAGSAEPDIWQHDVFHPDGRPYSESELDGLRAKV